MSEYISVIVSYCYSHCFISFVFQVHIEPGFFPVDLDVTSGYAQPFAFNNSSCKLLSGTIIHCSYSCPGHSHSGSALFLIESFVIQKPDRLILIKRQHYGFDPLCVRFLGNKTVVVRKTTYLSAFCRPRHDYLRTP